MFIEISQKDVGDVTVLKLKGRLILEDGDHPFRTAIDALVQKGRLKIVLDLSGVTYIDSAGLGVLVAKYVSVHRRGGTIKLLQPTQRAWHVLQITNLTHVFELFDSEAEAVRSFAKPLAQPSRV